MKAGNSAAIYPLLAGLAALDGPLHYRVYSSKANAAGRMGAHLLAGIGEANKPLPTGQTLTARLAGVQLPAVDGYYPPNLKRWGINTPVSLNPWGYNRKNLTGTALNALSQWRKGLVRFDPAVPDGIRHLSLGQSGAPYGGSFTFDKAAWPVPVLCDGVNPNWSAGVWYPGKGIHLESRVPPQQGGDFVVPEERTNCIVYFGAYTGDRKPWRQGLDTGTGFLQVDVAAGQRQVFIGNFITCSRKDFRVTFHHECPATIDPGGNGANQCAEVHNPTDHAAVVSLAAHPAFTHYKIQPTTGLKVPAGSTEVVIF